MFANLVAFPLGFWWRAPRAPWPYETEGAYKAPLRTSRHVGERAARANYGKTHVTWCCRGAPRRDAIKLVQIGQNQAAATHRNRYFYDLRSSPQLHVQFPGTSAAIKARNPRHPQKQLQHH